MANTYTPKSIFLVLVACTFVALIFYRPDHLLSAPIVTPIIVKSNFTRIAGSNIVAQDLRRPAAAAVKHLVMFEFRPNTTQAQIQNICYQMVTLQDRCVRLNTQEKYILSATGGRNNSREGLTNGLTHAFIMEFQSVADRDYYVDRDPFHQQFVNSLGPYVAGAQVIDFVPGMF